jgi:lysophospholipid acyltransferase (LPLAT)-like uncharacterized protein
MSKMMKKIITSPAFTAALYHFIRAYSMTLRLRVENEAPWKQHLDSGGRVLLCTWHQQFFSAIRHFQTYHLYHPALMISKSADGEVIAGVAGRSGWDPVRGSSSRQGREALYAMIEKLKANRLAGHIVDGPRGPAGIVKPGVIRLAHGAEAVIVPFYIDADKACFLDSWDRFMLPKPFARVTLSFDNIIHYAVSNDEEVFEQQRQELEARMRMRLHR